MKGAAKIGNTVKIAKIKMPLGHLYSFFNLLAYGYATIGNPTANNRDDAKNKMIISIRKNNKKRWNMGIVMRNIRIH